MKHNIGDLVARRDRVGEEIKLGYISALKEVDYHGYYIYFFDWDKDVWYLENDVDHFKQVLENWKNK